jgi:hypothetical protein
MKISSNVLAKMKTIIKPTISASFVPKTARPATSGGVFGLAKRKNSMRMPTSSGFHGGPTGIPKKKKNDPVSRYNQMKNSWSKQGGQLLKNDIK